MRRRSLLLGLALPAVARAQPAYPTRPIRMVVPFAPGGSADLAARTLAEPLGAALGQSVVVENRGGAGATLGAQAVAQSAPDGYTLLYATPGPQAINPHLMRNLPYDPVNGFTPIIGWKRAPNLVVVHPSLPARTLPELIALAKARPGQISFASSGIGASSHLAGEMLKHMAGIDIEHVPYRGSGQGMQDLVAGRVQMTIDTMSVMLPLVQQGHVRALAVSTPRRNALTPDLPAVAEFLPGYDAAPFNYVCGPAGVARPIVDKLNAAMNRLLLSPEILAAFASRGEEGVGGSPEDLARLIAEESARWRGVIQAIGLRVE